MQKLWQRLPIAGKQASLLRLAVASTVYVAQLCVFLAVVLFLLHGYNLYPEFLAQRQRTHANAVAVWVGTCDQGRNHEAMSNEFNNCAEAYKKSVLNPRLLAAEDLTLHFLQDLTLARWLLPHPSSASGYVVLRFFDSVLGFTPYLLMLGTVAALWCLWTFRIGPWTAYRKHVDQLVFSNHDYSRFSGDHHKVDVQTEGRKSV